MKPLLALIQRHKALTFCIVCITPILMMVIFPGFALWVVYEIVPRMVATSTFLIVLAEVMGRIVFVMALVSAIFTMIGVCVTLARRGFLFKRPDDDSRGD